jgi:hypothetical protein
LLDVFWKGLRRCTVQYHSGAPSCSVLVPTPGNRVR